MCNSDRYVCRLLSHCNDSPFTPKTVRKGQLGEQCGIVAVAGSGHWAWWRCERDEDVLPCRGRWEEARAMSVWVVVGRWLGSGCVVVEEMVGVMVVE